MLVTSPLLNGDVLTTFIVDDRRPVSVVGTFNDWNPDSHPLLEGIDGRRYVTVAIAAGVPVVFRYLADGGEFFDEPMADRIEPNGYGQTHSVLDIPSPDPEIATMDVPRRPSGSVLQAL